jgi:hypothetical protein
LTPAFFLKRELSLRADGVDLCCSAAQATDSLRKLPLLPLPSSIHAAAIASDSRVSISVK